MKLSILHISDLHRDPRNPISNQILIDSLVRDRDRYTSAEEPCIMPPDLIIVSGDIVQGVKYGYPDAEANLQKQYDEALDFLNGLTDLFLGGDKQLVVIVPGNHDVSDYHFRQSLEPIDIMPDTQRELVEQLFAPSSRLRWSWTEFRLYKIANEEMYRQRFGAFVDFYSRFYEGQRSYSINPAKQFDIFDFPDWGITIAGFCSCYNNDLFNKQGVIYSDCIAGVGERLRKFSYQDRLRIAVWHHNIAGPPLQVDYMDPDIVQNFIDSGFSLGFHGHQHKPQFFDTRFLHGLDRRINIISAGTLCGSAASRFGRAYNLIELDLKKRTGLLHVREMQIDDLQRPIWGPRSVLPNSKRYWDFNFDPPPKPFVRANDKTSLLKKSVELYDKGEYEEAKQMLSPLIISDKLARPLLLDCLIQLNDTASIITIFDPPESPSEAIALMDALWNKNKREHLAKILEIPLIDESTDLSVIEIRTKYGTRLKND